MVASFHRAVAENPTASSRSRRVPTSTRVESGERLGLMLALEGVECFGVETWPADVFHALGVRMAGLTWNRRNAFADGAAEDGGGLSRLGRELVDRLVELGVVLDLAHASRGSTPSSSSAPAARRSSARTGLPGRPRDARNLDDDQLRALRDAGGLFGLMLHPIAIGPERRTLDGVVDHLEHAVSVMGLDRVCLGGDFTKRLWQAMPPPPEPKDGLMPPGLTPGLGIEGLDGVRALPRARRAARRSRLERGGGRRRDRRQPPPLPPLGPLGAPSHSIRRRDRVVRVDSSSGSTAP